VNGWIWWSTKRATGALIYRDGVIAETPPYFRYLLGQGVPHVWLYRPHLPDTRIIWYPDATPFPLRIR